MLVITGRYCGRGTQYTYCTTHSVTYLPLCVHCPASQQIRQCSGIADTLKDMGIKIIRLTVFFAWLVWFPQPMLRPPTMRPQSSRWAIV